MYKGAPENYKCVICPAIQGIEDHEQTWINQADVFFQDELVTGFIGSKLLKGNEGYPMIVPNRHAENILQLQRDEMTRLMEIQQLAAQAMFDVRKADGVFVCQTNGEAAMQHAFHTHYHVIPRFEGDNFEEEFFKSRGPSKPEDRIPYADELREYFKFDLK